LTFLEKYYLSLPWLHFFSNHDEATYRYEEIEQMPCHNFPPSEPIVFYRSDIAGNIFG
jgi:hypothetical protein